MMNSTILSRTFLTVLFGAGLATSGLAADKLPGLFGAIYDGNAMPAEDAVADETRVDKELNFARGIPKSKFKKNFFGRWTGFIEIPEAGEYTFVLKSDDGSRMTIGGKTLIDQWSAKRLTMKTGKVKLSAGSIPITIEMHQSAGSSVLILGWVPPGGKKAIIPASALSHLPPPPPKPPTLAVVRGPAHKWLDHGKNPDKSKSPRGTGAIKNPKAPPAQHFKVEVLSPELFEPMEMVMLPTGNILICERKGELREFNPKTRETRLVIKLPVAFQQGNYASECGFLGLVPDPNFSKNNYLYCFYSVISKTPSNKGGKGPDGGNPLDEVNRLSRFTYKDGVFDLSSEVKILDVATDRQGKTCHEAGSLAFGPDGLLYLATGDNTNPFWKDASPMNPDNRHGDARRSAGNTADLRGAVLRLKINKDGSYDIPKGNLFKPGTPQTRPEIFIMGARNPYRITVNQRTGTLYWGEVSPDKNPTGEEINQAKTAGFHGWPYFIGDNLRFITPDDLLTDPELVVNTSPFNTGLQVIPLKPRPPFLHYNRSCAIIGEVYNHSSKFSKGAFPEHFDNCLFFGDWNRSWIQLIRMDKDENSLAVEHFPINFKFRKVIDFFFAEGELYVLEFGNGWFNTKGGRMCKISYDPGGNQQTDPKADQRVAGMDHSLKGTKLLLGNVTCLSCHNAQEQVTGLTSPSFLMLQDKYKIDDATLETLSEKVIKGGVGVWGKVMPMPAHPTYKKDDIKEMIKAMLATEKLAAGHKK